MDRIQQNLADFIAGCDYANIDNKYIQDIKYRIIDWLGCAITGAHYPQSTIARQFFSQSQGIQEATIIGAQGKYPAGNAALVNGIIGHVCELDDGHRKAIGHPGSVTLPVALALGEKLNASTEDFLRALILGYDLFARLGQAVNPSHYSTWHTTGTCGAFAATATAASLMRLDPQQTCHALGIVATLASGIQESFGTHAKALTIGHACQNAIYAASLAKLGYTGSPTAITGKKGFISSTCTEAHLDILRNPSEATLISDTAFYKIYASCGHTNSPLDALFSLLKQHTISPEHIKQITVETYKVAVDITRELKSDTEDAAKFSLPYCLSVAILFGEVSLRQFRPAILHDPDVNALAAKVQVVESAEATARFPKRQASVSIRLHDGTQYVAQVMDATDEVNTHQIEQKFRAATSHLAGQETENILCYLREMEQHADLTPLIRYLSQSCD
ncbi:MmgE/PrpD family protein [Trabulsiella odontotermitis]|uniref:MmgE/PrpD family protein n=1 Tax=Trabulsiella odontotermitis TaxID=379893 RepID=UPI003AC591E2